MPSSAQLAGRRGAASSATWILLGLALLLTVANAIKPLHMDDPFIYRVAEQMAAHPTDPYGFDIFWLQWPQPVSEELTPPVLPYWWAVGLRLFGERPWLWKLWLFPFAALLCFALHGLARRFAPHVALPLVAGTVLSPAVLPGFNLMQDLPAAALGLSALEFYLRAAGRGSLGLALGAGVLAGLATQTKYTSVGILGAIAAHALLERRVRVAGLTLSVSLALFFGWEALMTAAYGQGMFFGQIRYGLFWYPRADMVLPFLRLLGGAAPFLALWGLAGLGLPRRSVAGLACATLAAFAALAWWPAERALFVGLGLALVAVLGLVSWRLLREPPAGNAGSHAPIRPASAHVFLVAWLAIEIGVYFATSPFPAVRRVLGVIVVSTLLAGGLASRRVALRPGAVPAVGLAACSALLGFVFWSVDALEARAQETAATAAVATIRGIEPRPTIWFAGHWGFQYYAEREGMRAVVPDVSKLSRGDWLVLPREVHRQEFRLEAADARLVETLEAPRVLGLATGHGYYGESVPLSHLAGPRLHTDLFRMLRDVVPPSSWPPRQLADWAIRAGGRTAAAALPALIRALVEGDEEGRQFAAQGLGAIGRHAAPAVPELDRALGDPIPGVRYWAATALGSIGPAAASATAALESLAADPDTRVRQAAGDALARIR